MTAHTPNDGDGHGTGLGGSFGAESALKPEFFGPGSAMIDTNQPIRVSVYFGANANGLLSSIEVTLEGHTGRVVEIGITDEAYAKSLHRAVRAGMAPTVSYWSDAHLDWRASCVQQPCCHAFAMRSTLRSCGFAAPPLLHATTTHPARNTPLPALALNLLGH